MKMSDRIHLKEQQLQQLFQQKEVLKGQLAEVEKEYYRAEGALVLLRQLEVELQALKEKIKNGEKSASDVAET